jgi:hypothetical protein
MRAQKPSSLATGTLAPVAHLSSHCSFPSVMCPQRLLLAPGLPCRLRAMEMVFRTQSVTAETQRGEAGGRDVYTTPHLSSTLAPKESEPGKTRTLPLNRILRWHQEELATRHLGPQNPLTQAGCRRWGHFCSPSWYCAPTPGMVAVDLGAGSLVAVALPDTRLLWCFPQPQLGSGPPARVQQRARMTWVPQTGNPRAANSLLCGPQVCPKHLVSRHRARRVGLGDTRTPGPPPTPRSPPHICTQQPGT